MRGLLNLQWPEVDDGEEKVAAWVDGSDWSGDERARGWKSTVGQKGLRGRGGGTTGHNELSLRCQVAA